jgi:hypothetical protein
VRPGMINLRDAEALDNTRMLRYHVRQRRGDWTLEVVCRAEAGSVHVERQQKQTC